MYNCNSAQAFPNVESLRRHLESVHQKTFCKICLQGRTIFIREHRIYHIKQLRQHIEYGDPSNERGAEILPHPWCDFCEQYFFNELTFMDHLQRTHLTCHLCTDDQFKNMYYKNYDSLEIHFAKSHFICPYQECKSKCYVAFQTESELKTHMELVHSRRANKGQVNATALLGFKQDDDEEPQFAGKRGGKPFKKEKIVLQDKEGVDFRYYFGQKYQMCHSRNDNSKKSNKRGGGKQTEERKVEEQPVAKSTVTDEEKLSTVY